MADRRNLVVNARPMPVVRPDNHEDTPSTDAALTQGAQDGGPDVLEVHVVRAGVGNVDLTASGTLNRSGAALLAALLDQQSYTLRRLRIRLDLTEVADFDSPGVEVLLTAHRRLRDYGGSLRLTGLDPQLRALLAATLPGRVLLGETQGVTPAPTVRTDAQVAPDGVARPEPGPSGRVTRRTEQIMAGKKALQRDHDMVVAAAALVSQQRCSHEQAVLMLVMAAQRTGRPLAEVASVVARTGVLDLDEQPAAPA